MSGRLNNKFKVKVVGDRVIIRGLNEEEIKFFKRNKEMYGRMVYNLFMLSNEDTLIHDSVEGEEEEESWGETHTDNSGMYQ